jgi:hypothetical protein
MKLSTAASLPLAAAIVGFACRPGPVPDPDELDQRLHDAIATTFAEAGCPSDYTPERFVRGCFAAWPDRSECCYTAEYFTDETVCDPVPDETP